MVRTVSRSVRNGVFVAATLVCGALAAASPAQAEPSAGVLIVTTLADTSDPGSLRAAFEHAQSTVGDDVIQFAVSGTISLSSPLPVLSNGGVIVEGPGSGNLMIASPSGEDAGPAFVFAPAGPGNVAVSGLSISGGGPALVADFSGAVPEQQPRFEVIDVVIDGSANELEIAGIMVSSGEVRANVLVSGSRVQNFGLNEGSSAAQIIGSDQVTIENSSFDGNQAQVTGGLLLANCNDILISGSTFSNNSSGWSGGGVAAVVARSLRVVQSTFSGNHAAVAGGAIFINGVDTSSLEHSTVAGNVSDGYGGSAVSALLSELTIDSSIVSGNSGALTLYPDVNFPARIDVEAISDARARVLSEVSEDGTILEEAVVPFSGEGDESDAAFASPYTGTLTASLIGQAQATFSPTRWTISAGSIFELDAQLGPLANNGGDTLTLLPSDTSPVRDSGNLETLDGLELDQRGAARVVHGSVDIGSVEVQAIPTEAVVPNASAAQLPATGLGASVPVSIFAGLVLIGSLLIGLQLVGGWRKSRFSPAAAESVVTGTRHQSRGSGVSTQ